MENNCLLISFFYCFLKNMNIEKNLYLTAYYKLEFLLSANYLENYVLKFLLIIHYLYFFLILMFISYILTIYLCDLFKFSLMF